MKRNKKTKCRKRQEASYTVELSLLVPVLLFTLFSPVYLGYEMYGQTREASVLGWDEKFCAEDQVRKIKFTENILEEWK